MRLSRKLDHPTNGPFKIIEQVYGAYKLDLPDSIKVYPVFYASRLRKATSDPTPSQINVPPAPVNITSELEYEVKSILTVR